MATCILFYLVDHWNLLVLDCCLSKANINSSRKVTAISLTFDYIRYLKRRALKNFAFDIEMVIMVLNWMVIVMVVLPLMICGDWSCQKDEILIQL